METRANSVVWFVMVRLFESELTVTTTKRVQDGSHVEIRYPLSGCREGVFSMLSDDRKFRLEGANDSTREMNALSVP